MSDLNIFLKPLLLTILFEEIGAILFFKIRNRKDLFLILLVNIITNPLLVYFSLLLMYHLGIGTGRLATYLILEPIVVFTEYCLYRKYLSSRKDYLIMSVTLNIFSIIGGFIWQKIMF
ncbi:MAG: hypothetical protein J6S49_03490 [Erysipelotrichaceae bacterium]|nr:hypothetical protein [Erysipelotrichaceae bacterium]